MTIKDFAVIAACCLVADLIATFSAPPPAALFTLFFAQLVALISAYAYFNVRNLHSFIERVCRFLKAAARCWSESKETQK